MLSLHKYALLITLAASFFARGAEVLKVAAKNNLVAVTQDSGHPWNVKDTVCVARGKTDLGCGVIMRVMKNGAIAKMAGNVDDINPGDRAFYSLVMRKPTAVSGESVRTGKPILMDISAGINGGPTYLYPIVDIQFALGRHFSLGITPFYYTGTDASDPNDIIKVSAYGAIATFNFYSQDYFQGFWIQAGPAVHMMTGTEGASAPEKHTLFGGLATVGYRFHIGHLVNMGAGIGVHYKSNPNFSLKITDNSANAQFLGTADLGFSF